MVLIQELTGTARQAVHSILSRAGLIATGVLSMRCVFVRGEWQPPCRRRRAMMQEMAKSNLIQLITQAGRSEGEAADDLARAVESILRRLRKGETVALPGLGRLIPGRGATFRFEESRRGGGARGRR